VVPSPSRISGSYGIESFSAIINPPQAMIVSVGAIVKKPVCRRE
jgi:pyruvate dehydrogenase E2 component (dihydrolipoamide acetyltransferase)